MKVPSEPLPGTSVQLPANLAGAGQLPAGDSAIVLRPEGRIKSAVSCQPSAGSLQLAAFSFKLQLAVGARQLCIELAAGSGSTKGDPDAGFQEVTRLAEISPTGADHVHAAPVFAAIGAHDLKFIP